MASSSVESRNKPHAVCITIPAQGHINPMFKIAKILHHKGFHITFVYMESDHEFLSRSSGANSHKGLPSFRFETIPDGTSPSNEPRDASHVARVFESIATSCLAPFKELVSKLNESDDAPHVSCIISDPLTSFTLDASQELGMIPQFIFWPFSARSTFAMSRYASLVEKGYLPPKDQNYRTSGFLNTVIEDIPGLEGMRLRDLPSLMISANEMYYPMKFITHNFEKMMKQSRGFLLNTFEDLECGPLRALRSLSPAIYPIGPLSLLEKQLAGDNDLQVELGSTPWKEDPKCLEWLDSKEPSSVIYVNFGTSTLISHDQLTEFAWGLANSDQPFLWIIRPNLVYGEKSALLPQEFVESTKERGMVVSWCSQEKVLNHNSIGGFVTHNGWNSTLESISSGVPMICWPWMGDQWTDCWSCCNKWGIGTQISDVSRDTIERLVREMLVSDKGKEMKTRAMEWKKMAQHSVNNSSLQNLEEVIKQVALPVRKE